LEVAATNLRGISARRPQVCKLNIMHVRRMSIDRVGVVHRGEATEFASHRPHSAMITEAASTLGKFEAVMEHPDDQCNNGGQRVPIQSQRNSNSDP
jgi:hypothetical protein